MRLLGNNQLREMEPRRQYRPKHGWETQRRWSGTLEAINAYIPTLLADPNLEIDIDPDADGLTGVLTARIPDAQDGSDAADQTSVDFELDGNDRDISIYKRMEERGVPAHLASYIESWDNDMRSDKTLLLADAIAAVRGEASGVSPTYDEDDAEAWFTLVRSGVTTHPLPGAYVLRKTLTAPNAYVSGASLHVGELYTTAQLLAEQTTIPSGIQADMPSGGYWLKATPKRRTLPKGQIQITQEWLHGNEATALQYDLVT
jgi:hypothetical protein